jgi:ABC-type spermidine/putrescine transport system permease subunit I
MMTAPLTRRRSPRRRVRGALGTGFLLTPGGLLLVLFAALPLCALLFIGFTTDSGGFSFANFAEVFGSATYMSVLGKTLLIAFCVTVLSIALAWPAAWALARYTSPKVKPLILGFVIIPYITSQLLLIYGFVSLVQAGGPAMSVLSAMGLASPQTSIMYSPAANLLMLVQESIPTAILVMYAASEQIDKAVLEASRTLGANRGFVFTRVVWPLCSAMIAVNFALTFVQTVGAFAEPAILGGPNGQMLGNVISTQLTAGVHESFAVALSLVLLVSSLAIVGLVTALLAWSRSGLSGVSKSPPPKSISAAAQTRLEEDAPSTQGVLR